MIFYFDITVIDDNGNILIAYPIDEPVGWDSIGLRLKRDPNWHGFFDFIDDSVSSMKFVGEGMTRIEDAYYLAGIDASLGLRVSLQCDDDNNKVDIYQGRFNFDTFQKVCADYCYVSCGIESTSCVMKFKNRYDVPVSMSSLESISAKFDQTGNNLTDYGDYTLSVPSRGILQILDVSNENYTGSIQLWDNDVLAIYKDFVTIFGLYPFDVNQNTFNDVYTQEGYLLNGSDDAPNLFWPDHFDDYHYGPHPTVQYSPLIAWTNEYNLECLQELTWSIDLKQKVRIANIGSSSKAYGITYVIWKRSLANVWTPVWSYYNPVSDYPLIGGTDAEFYFEEIANGTLNIEPGDEIYFWICTCGGGYDPANKGDRRYNVFFNELDYPNHVRIKIEGISRCGETETKSYLINETLSHISESITDNCLKVYSEWYGRTDSLPYDVNQDGYGSLRAVTKGQLLRNIVLKDGSTPYLSLSMKECFDALNAIDNIGMSVEENTIDGGKWLRIERFNYFYDQNIILELEGVNEVTIKNKSDAYISTFKSGYSSWKGEEVSGQSEFMTTREYTTGIKSSNNPFEKMCEWIAATFTIEITRRQYGYDTTDWRYDDNTFLFQLQRINDKLEVETADAYTNLDNIDDPSTAYNLRISPIRMALMWLQRIYQQYLAPNGTNTAGNLVLFTKGENNTVAEGQLLNNNIFKTSALNEGDNLYGNQFQTDDYWFPFLRNEVAEFSYPLSFENWLLLYGNPKGLIKFNCGNEVKYGWILDLNYKPTTGMADFVLQIANYTEQ